MTDEPNPAQFIVNKFGGLKPFTEMTGIAYSTASYWCRDTKYIPPNQAKSLLAAAAEHGIDLHPTDFIRHLRG